VRIASVVCAYPPYRGGISNVAARHAHALTESGHEVEVICPAHEGAPGTDVVDGIVVHRLRPLVRHGTSALVPSVAGRIRGYDLLFLHYPFYGGAEPAALSARARRLPYLVFFHMDVVWDGVRGAALEAHRRVLAPLVLGGAHRVLVSSLDYAAHSSLARHRLGTLQELPYAIDTEERYTPGDVSAERRAALGLDPGRPVVLFVGAMDRGHAFKGVPELLRAMASGGIAERAQVALVGEGELRPGFEALARDLLPPGGAAFLGRVPEDDLVDLYRAAALTVLPSVTREEAFGVVLIESMACATPVVASDLAGVRAVVGDGSAGLLVPPGDVPALAEALAALLDDPGRRSAMGAAGRERAAGRYSRARERADLAAAVEAAS
jgi:glycosyltransferase involved in cell wall biosynthesis